MRKLTKKEKELLSIHHLQNNKGRWTKEEEEFLFEKVNELKNKMSIKEAFAFVGKTLNRGSQAVQGRYYRINKKFKMGNDGIEFENEGKDNHIIKALQNTERNIVKAIKDAEKNVIKASIFEERDETVDHSMESIKRIENESKRIRKTLDEIDEDVSAWKSKWGKR
ncbi:hypothetical protein PRVXT_000231 [Proteinivorax tanatarense]|uniref:Myb-like domain-containing protein n=1 Tax=Proteinivorax tanatarense TaxID=1260629 RepID=A0AAU7VM48_9FIRM